MCYLIYKILLLHSKMLFINEHWMLEVINIYEIFLMYEPNELMFSPNSEETMYYVFEYLVLACFLVV